SNDKVVQTTTYPSTAPNYVGCYTDDPSRALPNWLIDSGATLESCLAAAQAQGYAYAGLQWYGQCFAGNTVGFKQAPESDCNLPCTANPSKTCGGTWRNAVYATGVGLQ